MNGIQVCWQVLQFRLERIVVANFSGKEIKEFIYLAAPLRSLSVELNRVVAGFWENFVKTLEHGRLKFAINLLPRIWKDKCLHCSFLVNWLDGKPICTKVKLLGFAGGKLNHQKDKFEFYGFLSDHTIGKIAVGYAEIDPLKKSVEIENAGIEVKIPFPKTPMRMAFGHERIIFSSDKVCNEIAIYDLKTKLIIRTIEGKYFLFDDPIQPIIRENRIILPCVNTRGECLLNFYDEKFSSIKVPGELALALYSNEKHVLVCQHIEQHNYCLRALAYNEIDGFDDALFQLIDGFKTYPRLVNMDEAFLIVQVTNGFVKLHRIELSKKEFKLTDLGEIVLDDFSFEVENFRTPLFYYFGKLYILGKKSSHKDICILPIDLATLTSESAIPLENIEWENSSIIEIASSPTLGLQVLYPGNNCAYIKTINYEIPKDC